MDFLGYEPQFIDHLAPVWKALGGGRFLTDPQYVGHARALGLPAEGVVPPKAGTNPNPAPVFDGTPAVVASYGDIKKGRRMGYGPFVFLEHGIGQSYTGDPASADHPSYSGGSDRADVSLFLVPNHRAAARWLAAYPGARVEVVGCPKLDTLPARQGSAEPTIAISFHAPTSVCAETMHAADYYLSILPELARWFRVIGHAHPRFYGMARHYQAAEIEYVADFADVCRRADLYICDNSSTLYEFASTGRPVVVLNAPHYRRHVDHGLRFWEAAHVGINVDDPRDLIHAIDRALVDPPAVRAAREDALRIVYAYRTGAAARAAEAIRSLIPVAA